MGLLIECPACRKRIGIKKGICTCGKNVRKDSGKCYWIEYYLDGSRVRERIGFSKLAAENRFREVQTAKAESRHIRKNKNAGITIGQLREWYLGLSEMTQKRSLVDIGNCIQNFILRIGNLPVSQLNLEHVEKFRQTRLTEKTQTGRPASPSTINRDVANLRAMLNKGVKYGKIDLNPIQLVSMLEENNVRERVLTHEQFRLLLKKCPESIRGQVLIAYYLPMRQSEILYLRWEEIDFKNGFIRLGGNRTKNKSGRAIPIHPEVIKYLKTLPHPTEDGYVFSFRNWRRKSFRKAVNEAELGGFNFHDLRHCAINNLRLAGNDHFLIKQASGHKTDVAFRRYNLVTEDEMKGMKWYSKTPE